MSVVLVNSAEAAAAVYIGLASIVLHVILH